MKKNAFVLLMLISLIVSSTFCFQSVRAPSTANYIYADGSVSGTGNIQRDGDVYTFIGNVTNGLYIERDNIVVDGAGFTLQGSDGRGLVLSQRHNVTFKNARVTLDGGYSVEMTNASGCTISGNTFAGVPTVISPWLPASSLPSWSFGPNCLNLLFASNNTLVGNTIINCYLGIQLSTSNNNTITGNTISDTLTGIEFWNSTGNVLRNNHMNNNRQGFSVRVYELYDFANDVDTSNTVDGAPIYYWLNQQGKTVPVDAKFVLLVNCADIIIQNIRPEVLVLVSTTNSIIDNVLFTDSGGEGIDLLNCSKISITRSIIQNRAIGINLDTSSNNFINRCTIKNCTTRGVDFKASNNNVISENTIIDNGYAVASFQDSVSSGNKFSRNNFANNDFALNLNGGCIISDNVFTGNNFALMCSGGQNTITGNTFRNNSQVLQISGKDTVMRNNRMENNSRNFNVIGLVPSDYGNTNTVNILPNDIDASNTVDGKPIIYWVGQQDKTVPSNAACVILVSCRNITVQDLTLEATSQGIVLTDTTGSTMKNNKVTSNDYGVGLFGSSQNTIAENTITNNYVGMRISSSHDNTVTNNSFTENDGFAIIFTGTQKDNTIIHNNFTNNKVAPKLQISIDKYNGPGWGNKWDDDKEGNYWSDYQTRYTNATEVGNSGTGDTPFVINENNIDHHPLMKSVTTTPAATSTPPSTPELTPTPPTTTSHTPATTPQPTNTIEQSQTESTTTKAPPTTAYTIIAIALAITICSAASFLLLKLTKQKQHNQA